MAHGTRGNRASRSARLRARVSASDLIFATEITEGASRGHRAIHVVSRGAAKFGNESIAHGTHGIHRNSIRRSALARYQWSLVFGLSSPASFPFSQHHMRRIRRRD